MSGAHAKQPDTRSMVHREDCSLEECSGVYYARDFCRLHYDRFKVYGDPRGGMIAPPSMPLAERLSRFYTPGDPALCWEWTGSRHDFGHGYMSWQGKELLAHRALFEHHHRPLEPGEVVRHSCDNPPCVNPGHLLVGTQADNQRDKAERRRSTWGERNAGAVLTESTVRALLADRKLGMSHAALAAKYGISKTQTGRIVNGESWAHLTGN